MVAWLALVPAAGPLACVGLARVAWVFDVWTAFVPYMLAAAVLASVLAIVLKARWAACVGGAMTTLLLTMVGTQWGRGTNENYRPAFSVMSANVKTANRDFDRFVEFVRSDPPDVLAVLEVDEGWGDALDALSDIYPHRAGRTAPDNFGILLFSRVEWEEAEVVMLGEGATASVSARFNPGAFGERGPDDLTVLATHPVPPASGWLWRQRNRQLTATAAWAADVDGPLIVMGDLNVPPWSPFFLDLKRDGRLKDARRQADGLAFTWNARSPLIETSIDHVLYRRGLAAVSFEAGPDVGSDHRPVRATFDAGDR